VCLARKVCTPSTYLADSSRADDQPEILLEQWSNDLQKYSHVVEYVGKQPVSRSQQITRVINKFITHERLASKVSEVQRADRLQISCEHVSLELRSKTSETISSVYK